MSRGLGGVSRSWAGSPGSSQHTRSGAHEPCFLWPPEPRGRRRAVSQQPRALTTGRQELALRPIRMGPGGRGGPGQPCMPLSLGSHPSPASGPLLPGQPRAQWAPGVRVSISRARLAPRPADPWGLSAHGGPHVALACHTRIHSGSKVLCSCHRWAGSCPAGLPSRGQRPTPPSLANLRPQLAPSRGTQRSPQLPGGVPQGCGEGGATLQPSPGPLSTLCSGLQLAQGWGQPQETQGTMDSLSQPS